MPALLISLRVTNIETARLAFTEDRETRLAYGAGTEMVFRGVEDPANILIRMEWDGCERAKLYARSDDLREALDRAGITDPVHTWVLVDDGTSELIKT